MVRGVDLQAHLHAELFGQGRDTLDDVRTGGVLIANQRKAELGGGLDLALVVGDAFVLGQGDVGIDAQVGVDAQARGRQARFLDQLLELVGEIGRASCRERVS
jgi:hypothetical protein